MAKSDQQESVEWLIKAIQNLPADESVKLGTQGYNTYTTQKDHWLGWLNPSSGTGTYARKTGTTTGARDVYNRIVEPKLLAWLISASEVPTELVQSAIKDSEDASTLPGKSAAIRRNVPWHIVQEALKKKISPNKT